MVGFRDCPSDTLSLELALYGDPIHWGFKPYFILDIISEGIF